MVVYKRFYMFFVISFFSMKNLNAHQQFMEAEDLQRQMSVDSGCGDSSMHCDKDDEEGISSGGEEIEKYPSFGPLSHHVVICRPARPVSLPSDDRVENHLPEAYDEFISQLARLKMVMLSRQRTSTPIPSMEQRAAALQEQGEMSDASSSESDSEGARRKSKNQSNQQKTKRRRR